MWTYLRRINCSRVQTMESTVSSYDLAIAWIWEYDQEFIAAIEEAAHTRGRSVFFITRENFPETLRRVQDGSLSFQMFLDRASDEDDSFLALQNQLASQSSTLILNPHTQQLRAADKATMHLEFLSRGIEVPYTIIISPYNHSKEPVLSPDELAHLGRPFIIKPANTTGGGLGVITGAETLNDVLEVRQHNQNDKYLLQETIRPAWVSESKGWFRVLYCCGAIWPCWWDDRTHLYEILTSEDEEIFGLSPLRTITETIHDVCGLDFFSTEIVYTPKDRFVVVDYVNEICDMRPQSRHRDGVPDLIVQAVAERLVSPGPGRP